MTSPYKEIHQEASKMEVYSCDLVYAIQAAEEGEGSDADIRTLAEHMAEKAAFLAKLAKAIYPD